MDSLTLSCPVRGILKTGAKSKDGLKPSEEYFRVEAIKHFIKLGYPKDHIKVEATVKRFGNSGRNAMRADLVVLDVPVGSIPSGDIEKLLEHSIILVEVKRENSAQDYVKNTQVKPLLDFAKRDDCVAVYWDNVDQRVFWQERKEGVRVIKEGPLPILPKYGRKIHVKPLTFNDLTPADNLIDIFGRIENTLHGASVDLEQRFSVMLQLILAKLFDEHGHQPKPEKDLAIQDYRAMGGNANTALDAFNTVLGKAVGFYQNHLPKAIGKALPAKVNGDILMDICASLAPVCLIASKRDVVQSFYMKFSKDLYKWDLAQFFTPPNVTDYIVDILNPQFGEHIKDPACGSADFLTAAFHKRRDLDPNYADCIWGVDNSENAVQVAVLNMLLNGDGKSNIKEGDSLASVEEDLNRYDIMVCNPPFGLRIVEKRSSVLRKFDLGHEWKFDEESNSWKKDDKNLVAQQETGILFAETCIKQAKSGTGRVAIIFPNGYLGNRSSRYQVFREWLLRNAKIVAICSFPRFTFKTSGADVSASVLYLEKRESPIDDARIDDSYHVSVQMIENVGWNLGDKKAAPRYVRNLEDGSYIIDDDGERLLDADFSASLADLRASAAAEDFPWLVDDQSPPTGSGPGWSVPISRVLDDKDLTLDPKRLCRKFSSIRDEIQTSNYFKLGDIVDFIPEMRSTTGEKVSKILKQVYSYVELQNIGQGDYRGEELRGWELPQRAKHFAEGEDIYIGSIWGSVQKWCLIPRDAENVVVTNGCHRIRMKSAHRDKMVDLVAFLSAEAYSIQMRGFARGSDGLAEIIADDAAEVIVPALSAKERGILKPFVDSLLAGQPDIRAKVNRMVFDKEVGYPAPPKRRSHVALV
ncbi:HsdM family class I SAM-dependent methyltransferase [Roseibium sp.]|uniref:HsdM family class I SAM-dependent methyltransferase n=1 Tax=Roseibium sp. TaxID=1936156 RepID=UPI0039EFD5CF